MSPALVNNANSAPEMAIVAQSLSRSFRRRTRESGLRAAIGSFFKPVFVDKHAVQEMSFSIPRGLCVGVVGANGAGKTTLLKMIAGLLHPTSGSIGVLGYRPAQRATEYQKKIGMVMGQKSQLWIDIPASETFELLASIYEVPFDVYKRRVQELATTFQVEKLLNVQVRRLSLGERMKLEIMAALLHEPELLILDEPTIGLDVVSRRTIRRFIREYNTRKQTTILLSSHDMTDISEVCQKLLLVANGRILFDGPLADFENRRNDGTRTRDVSFVFDLGQDLTPASLAQITAKSQAKVLHQEPGQVKFRVGTAHISDLVSEVFRLHTPLDLQIESVDLEALVHEVMLT